MPQLWLTVDAAADALGISPSTVRRRIKADKLDSRSNGQGVTEVLVDTDGDDAESALNPGLELSARRRAGNTDDQLRANPWIRAARPGEALLADRRQDENPTRHTPGAATGSAADRQDDATVGDDPAVREQLEAAGRAFTPGDLESSPGGDELARFQKIAGASVLLAQQQATDAREQVALARHEAYRLRRLCYASWATTAAIGVLSFGLTLYLGYTASSAAARADAADRFAAGQRAHQQAQAIANQAHLERLAADPSPPAPPESTDELEGRFDASTTADVRRAPFE